MKILFLLLSFPSCLLSAPNVPIQPVSGTGSFTVTAGTGSFPTSQSGAWSVSPGTGVYVVSQVGQWKSTVTVENFPSTYPSTQSGNWSVSPGTGTYPSSQSGTWSVSPGTGTYPISIVKISTTVGDGAPGSDGYIYTEIYDGQENKEVQVSPIKELRVVTGHRLVGATFVNGFFDYNFWSSGTVTSGEISVASGSLCLHASSSTTGAANGYAAVQTLRIARFVSGSANEFRGVVRISTGIPPTGTNDMRWGVTDAVNTSTNSLSNGFYFRYSNGAFYVGYRTDGVETNISTTAFNGIVPTISGNYQRYQIVYTNLGATFYVDDKMVHKASPTTVSLTTSVNFRARAQNVNSGGSNHDSHLEAKVLTILRLGSESTTPVKKYLGTAGSYLLKFGPGFFHHITLNAAGSASSSITVYDSTYAATGNIVGVLDTSKTSIGSIDYDCPFDNGLFIVPAGTFGNITVVYE